MIAWEPIQDWDNTYFTLQKLASLYRQDGLKQIDFRSVKKEHIFRSKKNINYT